ncbi:uncharacterized protein C19orf44 homolog [Cheilinus undulatus]|uniref:uncharacterized protein C19orf44 homolog n=1 Tax=Cheilinus undulatus TaxID=241271 RepID=UPI001BD2C12B|nr:uncharacterized protein C19orf44 homolog [Cheilinus undulatus]
MWKRGSRSSALDRAEALLSAKRNNRGVAESVQESAARLRALTDTVDGHRIARTAPPNTQIILSDLSDLSSVSLCPEPEAATVGSAAVGRTKGPEEGTTRDVRPQSSLGLGGSRFLKKTSQPATNSNYEPQPRCVSSSQRSSQKAALNKLAQIESRIRSRTQAQEQAGWGSKSGEKLTSDLEISPPPAAKSLEAPVQLSAKSSSDQSLGGKRFLKNTTAVAAKSSDAADGGFRSRSRVAEGGFPLTSFKTKSVGRVSSVNLESDEEDMKKLLGDSLDSMDNSFSIPVRPSSERTANKMLNKRSPNVDPTAATSSSITVPPRSPGSPSCRSSPFRFTGQAKAHFSPSVLSLSPSPPRQDSSQRAGSPQRSLSSMSGRSEVMSLDDLCPLRSSAQDPQSEMSEVSTEDFKINVMTLDDLVPAFLGVNEDTPGDKSEAKHGALQQLQTIKEQKEDERQQTEEDLVDYQSDFESESRKDPEKSASQVSEHLQGHGDEEEVISEVNERSSDSDVPHGRTEDDYSSTFSDTSRSYTPGSADHSQTVSRSRDSKYSRSSVSKDSRSRRRESTKKVLREKEAQTQPDPLAGTLPTGIPTLDPAEGMAYTYPSPMVTHTLSAERVDALSTFNPAAFALTEILKQQLTMIKWFMDSSRQLYLNQVKSLGPPDYRYTTLEDTLENIRKQRSPKPTLEEAMEEVMKEMKDFHHI